MHFLDVKTDFAFKKVFGSEQSKNVLISFLNAIIDFGEKTVTDLTIVDPYQIPLLKGMKDSYVDLKAVLSDQTKVIVEMQVLNAAKLYSTQLKKAGQYKTLEPIIALTITDFEMFPEFAKKISYWDLREREVLLEGPAGTGKSRCMGEYLHWIASNYPGVRLLVVRKTRASLTQSWMVTFESKVVEPDHPILKGPARAHRASYVYPNGSEIVLGGMDRAERLYSTEYDVIYVNGDNNLENLRREDQTWKVRLIEEDFQRLMFDVQDV